ncbi:hypothetical protein D3C84_1104390 [compost metagenome]
MTGKTPTMRQYISSLCFLVPYQLTSLLADAGLIFISIGRIGDALVAGTVVQIVTTQGTINVGR